MPAQTFTHQATTRASVDEVWSALDRPETWEAIGGVDRVVDPEIDDQGRLVGFSFETIAAGRRYFGVATPRERVERETMSWNVANREVEGVTTVDIAPDGEGTAITVTLDVSSVGLLSSMFFPVIAAAIGNGLPESVDSFAAAFDD